MKRYALFTAEFALVPMVSGPFVVSTTGPVSGLEWAHIISGFATVYLIIGLILIAAKNRKIRPSAIVALAAALLETIPGMPQIHAVISPVLFAALAWAVVELPETPPAGSRRMFLLPALVLLPIIFGVEYRHQTGGFLSHLGAALPVAGLLIICPAVLNERYPANPNLRRVCNLMIVAASVQVVLGMAAFVIRMMELQGGLLLSVARTAHITGAALVLAASAELAIQYRRGTA